MKRWFQLIIALIILTVVFSLLTQRLLPRNSLVIKVIDGDTIELEGERLLRYIGINTPELRVKAENGSWKETGNPFAQMAYELNRNLVEGKIVTIKYDKEKKDRFGRLLGYVFIGDTFVNEKILEEGLAELYFHAPNLKYANKLSQAFSKALNNRKGIWYNLRVISAQEADHYLGQAVAVKDKVLDRYSGKEVAFLILPHNLRIVFFKELFPLFGDSFTIEKFVGKEIIVYGIIKKHRGIKEIIVDHPVEIELRE